MSGLMEFNADTYPVSAKHIRLQIFWRLPGVVMQDQVNDWLEKNSERELFGIEFTNDGIFLVLHA